MSSRRRNSWAIWILVVVLGVLGLSLRLYLDSVFEKIAPQKGMAEAGFVDSFMFEASRSLTEEGKDE